MGFSGWTHIDFAYIEEETPKYFYVVLEDYQTKVLIPKKKTAFPKDYKKGDKNGVISVKDEWAEENGFF